jgi:hypothetical protein
MSKLHHIPCQMTAGNQAAGHKTRKETEMRTHNTATRDAVKDSLGGWGLVTDTRTPAQKAQAQKEWQEYQKKELVRELLTPEPWPMTADEIEERRSQVEVITKRPFPRVSREALWEDEIKDQDAMHEWDLLDALHRGTSPDIDFLFPETH